MTHYCSLCKRHFRKRIKNELQRQFRNLYRAADKAYSSMDYEGVGFIVEDSFISSMGCQKSGYSREDLIDFAQSSGLFKTGTGMNFDSFKKAFFPHLYLINDDAEESEDERRERQEKRAMIKDKAKQPEII